jgi:hypothetical protein
MVESTAQSGRMRTLIHRGPITRGHVKRLTMGPVQKNQSTSVVSHLIKDKQARKQIRCIEIDYGEIVVYIKQRSVSV